MSITQWMLFSIAQWLRITGPRRAATITSDVEIKPGFLLDFSPYFPRALDHRDGLQARPVMLLLQPFDIVDDGGFARLNPTLVAVNRGILADFAVGKAACLLCGGE